MANVSLSPLQIWKPWLIKLRQTGESAGVTLKVRHSDRTLHLLLEGACISSRKAWVGQIQTLLENYPVESIPTDQILIYGRVQGKRYPAWKATIDLKESLKQSLQHSLNHSLNHASRSGTTGGSAERSAERSAPARKSWRSLHAHRSLRPAVRGLKDVLSSGAASPQNLAVPKVPRINPEILAQLSPLGSQQWFARSILGLFLLGLMLYLYIGTWFIPQELEKWGQLQSDLDRIIALEPRNLKEMETLAKDLEETIAQLNAFSPLSGTLYPQARARLKTLQARQDQLQSRQTIEQRGQAYLGEAKRLAAEAMLLLETEGNPLPKGNDSLSVETDATAYKRSVQYRWLEALYWLNQIPGQTFAAQERYRLLSQYQKAYWQIYKDAQTIPVQW